PDAADLQTVMDAFNAAAEPGAQNVRPEDLRRHWVSVLAPRALALLRDDSIIVPHSSRERPRRVVFEIISPDGWDRAWSEVEIEEDGDEVRLAPVYVGSSRYRMVLGFFAAWFATSSGREFFVEWDLGGWAIARRAAAGVNQSARQQLESWGTTLGNPRSTGNP